MLAFARLRPRQLDANLRFVIGYRRLHRLEAAVCCPAGSNNPDYYAEPSHIE